MKYRPQILDGFFEVDPAQAMADIYVWLRYSSTRQLTWQRNYNTQPRMLSGAQVREAMLAGRVGHGGMCMVDAVCQYPSIRVQHVTGLSGTPTQVPA
jgi:hypothetical protein